MKKHYTFEEVEFAGQLLCVNATAEFTHVPFRPATQWQPPEGGHYDVEEVEVTSVETETETIRRARDNTLDWCQLDGIAADRVDALMEQYERDF